MEEKTKELMEQAKSKLDQQYKVNSQKESKNQIVKNESKAYGYNYASLADIVNQGYELPKMVTRIVEGETFIFWYDKETSEWLQGAPLVVPEMKGMNAAQAMGSALTYARRYTAQMALGLACDDDEKLEKTNKKYEATGKVYERQATPKQIEYIRKLLGAQGLTPTQIEEQIVKVKSAKQATAVIEHLSGSNNG